MEKRKKGTMNNVKLLHTKCCFFQFFNSPVALKNKINSPPKKKLKWRPWSDYQRIWEMIIIIITSYALK